MLASLGGGTLQVTRTARPATKSLEGCQRLINAYAEALVEEGMHNPNLVVLDGDLAKDTGLLPFEQRFPDRFFECGIAEQDMVSQAGAMALSGLLPIVHSFACFLSDRPNEQIYNNATEYSKVIYASSLAGLLPSGPGHSHQCVRDVSALTGMPGLLMFEPSCEQETRLALRFACRSTPESFYLRLVSVPWRVPFALPNDYQLTVGQGVILREARTSCSWLTGRFCSQRHTGQLPCWRSRA
jgi:transketolase